MGPATFARFYFPDETISPYRSEDYSPFEVGTVIPKIFKRSAGLQVLDVLMYGDTLVEAWRGTFLGEPSLRAQGCADIFHNQFGMKFRAAALGIAGDQALHIFGAIFITPPILSPLQPSVARHACDFQLFLDIKYKLYEQVYMSPWPGLQIYRVCGRGHHGQSDVEAAEWGGGARTASWCSGGTHRLQ